MWAWAGTDGATLNEAVEALRSGHLHSSGRGKQKQAIEMTALEMINVKKRRAGHRGSGCFGWGGLSQAVGRRCLPRSCWRWWSALAQSLVCAAYKQWLGVTWMKGRTDLSALKCMKYRTPVVHRTDGSLPAKNVFLQTRSGPTGWESTTLTCFLHAQDLKEGPRG